MPDHEVRLLYQNNLIFVKGFMFISWKTLYFNKNVGMEPEKISKNIEKYLKCGRAEAATAEPGGYGRGG